jgi:F0F1-type ATP synthase alpha subunit
VSLTGRDLAIDAGDALLGRVIDPLGAAPDGEAPPQCRSRQPLERAWSRKVLSASEPRQGSKKSSDMMQSAVKGSNPATSPLRSRPPGAQPGMLARLPMTQRKR